MNQLQLFLPCAAGVEGFLADETVLTQATTALGAGYWVLTPLQTSEGTQVLVNRGFVPQDQRARWQGGAGADKIGRAHV